MTIPTAVAALMAVGIFTTTTEGEVVIAAAGSAIQTGGAVPLFERDVSRVVVVGVERVGDDQKEIAEASLSQCRFDTRLRFTFTEDAIRNVRMHEVGIGIRGSRVESVDIVARTRTFRRPVVDNIEATKCDVFEGDLVRHHTENSVTQVDAHFAEFIRQRDQLFIEQTQVGWRESRFDGLLQIACPLSEIGSQTFHREDQPCIDDPFGHSPFVVLSQLLLPQQSLEAIPVLLREIDLLIRRIDQHCLPNGNRGSQGKSLKVIHRKPFS